MSRAARSYSQSGVYHIVFRGVNQQNIFEESADYEKLKETIRNVKNDMDFEIYAYCFMGNHVHIVLKERQAQDISLIMKRILTKYARWYNIKYGRSGALIANRYKSVPVEIDEYFLQLIRYVHQNPIKANIVTEIEKYNYSSYQEYLTEADITDVDFVYSMISKNEFIKYHQEMGDISFRVTDSRRKTDDEVYLYIKKQYGIENPKDISKMNKTERDRVLADLKGKFSVRQLQRLTAVSRGVIAKAK